MPTRKQDWRVRQTKPWRKRARAATPLLRLGRIDAAIAALGGDLVQPRREVPINRDNLLAKTAKPVMHNGHPLPAYRTTPPPYAPDPVTPRGQVERSIEAIREEIVKVLRRSKMGPAEIHAAGGPAPETMQSILAGDKQTQFGTLVCALVAVGYDMIVVPSERKS